MTENEQPVQDGELERLRREFQQFTHAVSHDLHQPLRQVQSFSDLLKKDLGDAADPEVRTLVGHIVSGASRAQKLLDDLLEYSRIGAKEKVFWEVDCEPLLDHVITTIRPRLEQRGGSVTRTALPTVLGDPAQLSQLLEHLLDNGLKFIHPARAPRIRISAEQKDREWVFAVQDNGIGIDEAHSDRVFGMFQRLHTRAEYPGTGAGLALCSRIVERHGGRMWLESEVKKGSTFYFTLSAT